MNDISNMNRPDWRRSEWGTGRLCRGLSPEQISACYVDQAPEHANAHPYKVLPLTAAWTPYGIRAYIEGRFIERILQVGTPEFEETRHHFDAGSWCLSLNPRKDWYPSLQTVEELEEAIIAHPSLHPVIKDNLLHNLYLKLGRAE